MLQKPENPKRAPTGSWHLHDLGDGISVFHCPDDSHFAFRNSEEYWALMEWFEFHGLDQCRIPADDFIYRNEKLHTITVTYFVLNNKKGRIDFVPGQLVKTEIHQEQGEAGPLPWPDILGTPVPVDGCGCAT